MQYEHNTALLTKIHSKWLLSTCSERVMYHGIVDSKIRIGTSTPCDIIGQTERTEEVLM